MTEQDIVKRLNGMREIPTSEVIRISGELSRESSISKTERSEEHKTGTEPIIQQSNAKNYG